MASTPRDYYEILGVPRNASEPDIHRAFRGLARQWHPDVSPRADAAGRFQELSSAYQVLHDPIARARYDHSAVNVRRREPRGGDQRRPTFVSRARADGVPRFLDEPPTSWSPIGIRLGAVIRWLS